MWCHVVWTTGNNISQQPTVYTFLISPSHSVFLLFRYPEDGVSRHVNNYHASFQKFPTCPQHMGIDTRSVATQLSLGGLLQFQLNKADWKSASQMHSHLTFWHWMSHRCSHGMKCQSTQVCSPKLSCKIFSCDTLVLELFHIKLQATSHITINHRVKQCNLPTITISVAAMWSCLASRHCNTLSPSCLEFAAELGHPYCSCKS
jgi:hypothetical protein